MRNTGRARFWMLVAVWITVLPLAAEEDSQNERVEDREWGQVRMERGSHAILSFGAGDGVTIDLHGKLTDSATSSSLANVSIQLVRFEMEGNPDRTNITHDDVAAAAVEVNVGKTEEDGWFTMRDLEPGRYSLEVKWDEVRGDIDIVAWSLEWLENPTVPRGSSGGEAEDAQSVENGRADLAMWAAGTDTRKESPCSWCVRS